MSHETTPGPRESITPRRHAGTGGGEQSPLQGRARFLENWDWAAITNLNRRLCEGQRAQHGPNPESRAASQKEWEDLLARSLIGWPGQLVVRARVGLVPRAQEVTDDLWQPGFLPT